MSMTAEEIKDLVCGKCQDDYCEVNEGANCQHLNDMLDKYEAQLAKDVCPRCGGAKPILMSRNPDVYSYCPTCQGTGKPPKLDREKIAKILRVHHYKFPHSYGNSDEMREATYKVADQIIALMEG